MQLDAILWSSKAMAAIAGFLVLGMHLMELIGAAKLMTTATIRRIAFSTQNILYLTCGNAIEGSRYVVWITILWHLEWLLRFNYFQPSTMGSGAGPAVVLRGFVNATWRSRNACGIITAPKSGPSAFHRHSDCCRISSWCFEKLQKYDGD